jgi:hypothetical protein
MLVIGASTRGITVIDASARGIISSNLEVAKRGLPNGPTDLVCLWAGQACGSVSGRLPPARFWYCPRSCRRCLAHLRLLPADTSNLFAALSDRSLGSARLGMKSEQLGVVAIALVAASFLCAPTTPASANPVLPGGTVTPDLFGAISGSVLATTGTVPLTSVPASFMSTYVAEVVADAGRGGLLDFILQTTNSPASGDALGRITLTSFAGFATDVGTAISAGGLAGGTAPPVNITRSSAGNVIGFNFAPGVLSPGTTSPRRRPQAGGGGNAVGDEIPVTNPGGAPRKGQ